MRENKKGWTKNQNKKRGRRERKEADWRRSHEEEYNREWESKDEVESRIKKEWENAREKSGKEPEKKEEDVKVETPLCKSRHHPSQWARRKLHALLLGCRNKQQYNPHVCKSRAARISIAT